MTMLRTLAFVQSHIGDDLVSAFVYGSAAVGHAGPSSDLDCFTLVYGLSAELRARIAVPFAEFQRSLGYSPDPEYPVEVFTVDQCRTALTGDLLRHILTYSALTGRLDSATAECDDVEILRALLDHRVVLRQSPELHSLTALAHEVLGAYPGDEDPILGALRLRPHTASCRATSPQDTSLRSRDGTPAFAVCCFAETPSLPREERSE